jgi:glycosyltransferase involved in cell wall biosynthesis
MKLLMLVLNTFENDSRVHRTAKTLTDAGVDVTLLCLFREGLPEFENSDGYNVIRCDLLTQTNAPDTIRHRIESLKEEHPVVYYLSLLSYLPIWITYKQSKYIFNLLKVLNIKIRSNKKRFLATLKEKYRAKHLAPVRIAYRYLKPKIRGCLKFFLRLFIIEKFLRTIRKSLRVTFKIIKKIKSYFLFVKKYISNFIKKLFPKSTAQIAFEKRRVRYDLFAEAAIGFAKEFKPDVVHAHDFNTLIAAYKIWKRLEIPYVYDSHELWVHRNRPNIVASDKEKKWEERSEGKYIKNSTFSITVCDSIADHLAETYQIPKPTVIRNTPYQKTIQKDPKKSLRKLLKIKPNEFLAVYVGRVAFNRGVTDILRALPLLDRKVKFVTLGAFDAKFQIVFEELVSELEIEDRVFCIDPVASEDVSTWISDVDVSLTTMNRVCLSYVYTLPNKLFESVHAGVPIIGPDSPEIIRIVDKYNCGLVYRDMDSTHLAEQINYLMNNTELAQKFKMGAELAAADLCWEKERLKLLGAYKEFFKLESDLLEVSRNSSHSEGTRVSA